MALLFCDSFDHYTTNAQLATKWGNGNFNINSAWGRNGTAGIGTGEDRSSRWTKSGTGVDTIIVGFANNFISGTPNTRLNLYEDATLHIYLYPNAGSLKWQVYRGDGTLLGTSSPSFAFGIYDYIELKVKIHDTTGTVDLRVNNVSVLSLTGQDTRNGGTSGLINAVLISSIDYGSVSRLDDFYVCDTSGSRNNDFLGDVRIQAIFPSATGNSSQWTANGAATNRECVDEITPNDDTDYISSSTATQKDTYVFGDVTPTSGTVKAVQHVLYARKDDAGTRTIRPVIRHSTTDYTVGAGTNISITYAMIKDISETNPGTSTDWTISDVNNAEFGVELVA